MCYIASGVDTYSASNEDGRLQVRSTLYDAASCTPSKAMGMDATPCVDQPLADEPDFKLPQKRRDKDRDEVCYRWRWSRK